MPMISKRCSMFRISLLVVGSTRCGNESSLLSLSCRTIFDCLTCGNERITCGKAPIREQVAGPVYRDSPNTYQLSARGGLIERLLASLCAQTGTYSSLD